MSTRSSAVSSLAAARQRKARREQPHTVILSAHMEGEGTEPIVRHLGLSDHLTIRDLAGSLDTAFDFHGQAPWHMHAGDYHKIPGDEQLREYCRGEDDTLVYVWGLWNIIVRVVDVISRDELTPQVLCIGGHGMLGRGEFDLSAVNARLMGEETITAVLRLVRSEVAALIRASKIYDFVSLLQAMDLERGTALPADIQQQVERLPLETDPQAREAFWAVILAESCLGDTATTEGILTAVAGTLGWERSTVRSRCADSLAQLTALGAIGPNSLAPVERLEIFRQVLRCTVIPHE